MSSAVVEGREFGFHCSAQRVLRPALDAVLGFVGRGRHELCDLVHPGPGEVPARDPTLRSGLIVHELAKTHSLSPGWQNRAFQKEKAQRPELLGLFVH
jgi:hypothetical protein